VRRPTVILHGWGGSGPDHWQSWLAGRLAPEQEVRYPQLPEPDEPTVTTWLAALDDVLRGLPEGGYDVLCHSLAVQLWLHHAARLGNADNSGVTGAGGPRPARVLLVAPPSPRTAIPELATFFPPPLDVDAVRQAAGGTVLVCSDNDPCCPEGAALAYGRPLKLPVTVLPGAGHVNVDAGYGSWPDVETWCLRPNLAFPL
jgi:uncharacterized protein